IVYVLSRITPMPALSLCCILLHHHPRSTLFPYTTLFRSGARRRRLLRRRLQCEQVASAAAEVGRQQGRSAVQRVMDSDGDRPLRSEEHTSELQSRFDLVCRLLLEKKKTLVLQVYETTKDV